MNKEPTDNPQGSKQPRGIKKLAASGAIFVLPVIVTLFIVVWLLGFVSAVPGMGVLELTSYSYVNQAIKLVALTVTSGLLFTGAGKLVDTKYGLRLEKVVDSAVTKIPIVGAVYSTTKTTTETVLGGADFGKPVEVDLGSVSLTGFRTGNGKKRGQSMVFVPTSPNITSGFLVEIDDEWVKGTEETRTEAITRVLSAGFGSRFEHEGTISGKQEKLKTEGVQ